MNVLQGIRRAADDYYMRNFHTAGFVYMNRKTFLSLVVECKLPEDYEKRYIPQVCGMTVVNKEELPDGVVVVGGVVHDCRTDDEPGVKPVYDANIHAWECGDCGQIITWSNHSIHNCGQPLHKWNFCKGCGKKVDWSGK